MRCSTSDMRAIVSLTIKYTQSNKFSILSTVCRHYFYYGAAAVYNFVEQHLINSGSDCGHSTVYTRDIEPLVHSSLFYDLDKN